MTIFSGQSVISRVYTSRFGNGTGSHGTSTEVVLKKYQVPGTVPSGKPPKSEPYRTVPCRTMQWKSAISMYIVFLGGQHMNTILFISVMYRTYEEEETIQAK